MTPGEIHWVDLPPADGREQSGRRPAIILLDDAYAGRLPVVLVVPITSAANLPTAGSVSLWTPIGSRGYSSTGCAAESNS